MTTHSQHSNLGTWIGLAVGLALAWGGWVWWLWYIVPPPTTVGLPMNVTPSLPETVSEVPRHWTVQWWTEPLIITLLAIFALLCAVAGAMMGRRNGQLPDVD